MSYHPFSKHLLNDTFNFVVWSLFLFLTFCTYLALLVFVGEWRLKLLYNRDFSNFYSPTLLTPSCEQSIYISLQSNLGLFLNLHCADASSFREAFNLSFNIMVKKIKKNFYIIPLNVHSCILIYKVPILHFFKQILFVTKHEGSSMAIFYLKSKVQWQFASHKQRKSLMVQFIFLSL